MKQQIVIIGGGETFDDYSKYVHFLQYKMKFNLEARGKNWKETLQKKLGADYEVIHVRMPSPLNAKYLEWEIYFRKVIPHLRDNVVFVGHSLGALFLVKFMSEHTLKTKVAGLMLVSAPYNISDDSGFADFVLNEAKFFSFMPETEIQFYHGKDDRIVKKSNMEDYHRLIPNSKCRLLKEGGHFIFQPTLPFLVPDIKRVCKNMIQ